MVDFQIKLQDNKVSEWSDHYMHYAALKKILKKAKSAQEKYQVLKKFKNGKVGQRIRQQLQEK
jgi:SPX domain protein involved in polyphosphate accumulation